MNWSILIDVGLVLIVLISLLFGAKRGFLKTIKGFIAAVLVLVIAGVTIMPLTNVIISGTNWDEKLQTKLIESMSAKIPNANVPIYYDDSDGDGVKELVFTNDNDEKQPYEKIFDNSKILKLFNIPKLIRPVIEKQIDKDAEYNHTTGENSVVFIDIIAQTLTFYIFVAAGFIILAIILRILFAILFALLSKVIASLYIVHFLDKLLGAIIGLLIGCLVVLILVTIVQFVKDVSFMAPMNNYLAETNLWRLIEDNNFLFKLISSKFDISGMIAKITNKK